MYHCCFGGYFYGIHVGKYTSPRYDWVQSPDQGELVNPKTYFAHRGIKTTRGVPFVLADF